MKKIKDIQDLYEYITDLPIFNPVYRLIGILSDYKYRIKYAFQRMFRGYDDPNVFEFHSQMTDRTIKTLKELEKISHGHPVDDECNSEKEWKKILGKIIKGFEAAQKIDNNDYMIEVKLKNPRKSSLGEMIDYGFRFDKRKYEKLHKQFDEGMELFHRYYFALWD